MALDAVTARRWEDARRIFELRPALLGQRYVTSISRLNRPEVMIARGDAEGLKFLLSLGAELRMKPGDGDDWGPGQSLVEAIDRIRLGDVCVLRVLLDHLPGDALDTAVRPRRMGEAFTYEYPLKYAIRTLNMPASVFILEREPARIAKPFFSGETPLQAIQDVAHRDGGAVLVQSVQAWMARQRLESVLARARVRAAFPGRARPGAFS
jgi:hypothetical protein